MNPSDPIKNSYNNLTYQCTSLAEAHLERLWSIGNLYTISAALPSNARVLELGCGTGAHIIALAFQYPKSSFVGIELSEKQATIGQQQIKQLGLQNIEIQAADLSTIESSSEPYDYIIAHGVYSWIPGTVQQALLRLTGDSLAENGIFYLSFNTLPGWYTKLRARDIIQSQLDSSQTISEQLSDARKSLEEYRAFCSREKPSFAKDLEPLLDSLIKAPDWYLLHEYLTAYNTPEYFSDFLKKIQSHNLHYVADADLSMTSSEELESNDYTPSLTQELRFTPEYEQAYDLYSDRMMRRAILSKQSPNFSKDHAAAFIQKSCIASPAYKFTHSAHSTPHSGTTFRIGDRGTVIVQQPETAELMKHLGEIWPCSMETIDFEGTLHFEDLIELVFQGALLLESNEAICAKTIYEKPTVSALTRLQLSSGHITSGIRGEQITFDNALARLITFFLEGEVNEEALFEIIKNVDVSFGTNDESEKSLHLENLTQEQFSRWYQNVCQKLLEAGLLTP